MARPIICGVDDSDRARSAVQVADDLAGRLDEPLDIVHVAAPLPTVLQGVPAAVDAYTQAVEREAEELLARAVERCESGQVTSRLEWGTPVADVIARLAEERNARLVVLGSHGRGALTSLVLGSVTQQTLARAPCPVVVVPPTAA